VIVVTSRIRVTHGSADALADQYRRRGRQADAFPGCLGVEILRSSTEPDEFLVYTRWRDAEAYDAYRRSPAYRDAHARIADIPGGVRIDATERLVEWFEVLS
jgi:heme-degrading monooxygenase HmoA